MPLIATNVEPPQDGIAVSAYRASRFTGTPSLGSLPPGGGADAGPVLTSGRLWGATGNLQITTPTSEPYWLGAQTPDGVWHWAYFDTSAGTGVSSVSAGDGTIVIGGTVGAPTVRVGAVPYSALTGTPTIPTIDGTASDIGTQTAGASATAGAIGKAADAGHVHPFAAGSAGASAPGDAAGPGTATSGARSDHKHSREGWGLAGDIASPGGAAAAGAVGRVADAGHVHVGVASVAGRTGAIVLAEADVASLTTDLAAKAAIPGTLSTTVAAVLASDGTVTVHGTANWQAPGTATPRVLLYDPTTGNQEIVLVTSGLTYAAGDQVCTVTRGGALPSRECAPQSRQAFTAGSLAWLVSTPGLLSDLSPPRQLGFVQLPVTVATAQPFSAFDLLTVTVTIGYRPVVVRCCVQTNGLGSTPTGYWYIQMFDVTASNTALSPFAAGGAAGDTNPPDVLAAESYRLSPAAGTHTYKVQVASTMTSGTMSVINAWLSVDEVAI